MILPPDVDTLARDASGALSTPYPDVGTLLADDAVVDAAVAAAQRDAVRAHHLLGRPVVVWRAGRVVEETTERAPEAAVSAPAAPTPTDTPRP
jgi:hypothetical protein